MLDKIKSKLRKAKHLFIFNRYRMLDPYRKSGYPWWKGKRQYIHKNTFYLNIKLTILAKICEMNKTNIHYLLYTYYKYFTYYYIFSLVAQSCPTLCQSMNHSTSGLPVHHQLPEFTQIHVHWVGDAIQPSHPLLSPFLLPPIPPSIRIFSNESTLLTQWPD